jgi:hypothetical protein
LTLNRLHESSVSVQQRYELVLNTLLSKSLNLPARSPFSVLYLVPFPVNNLVLHRQGEENAKSISVFCTHNFLVCLVSWWLKNTSSFLRNGTSISHLFHDIRWQFVKSGGDGTESEKMHPLQKKNIYFFYLFFFDAYIFFSFHPLITILLGFGR